MDGWIGAFLLLLGWEFIAVDYWLLLKCARYLVNTSLRDNVSQLCTHAVSVNGFVNTFVYIGIIPKLYF